MKKKLYLFALILVTACATPGKLPSETYIQQHHYQAVIGDISKLANSEKPDKYAMYPYGSTGIANFISKKTTYPADAFAQNITGKVILDYIVEKDGTVGDIKVVQSVHPILDNEAIRVLSLMNNWIPGSKDGKPVRIKYQQPFNFAIK